MEENRRTRACRGLGAVVGDALARQLVGRRQVVLVDDDADDSAGDAVGDEKEVLLESLRSCCLRAGAWGSSRPQVQGISVFSAAAALGVGVGVAPEP